MDDSLAAVIAHGLLNSLAVVQGGVATLHRVWDGLSVDQRKDMADTALSQAELMADGLEALPSPVRHRLANHLFVVRGVCLTLLAEGCHLDHTDRRHLADVVQRQADHAATVLHEVVRGLPADVLAALDDMGGHRPADGEATA